MNKLLFSISFLILPWAHAGYIIPNYPILEALADHGAPLAPTTVQWMNKWTGMDLESGAYSFPGLTGNTSINLKIKSQESLGTFVPRNSSGNPYAEIAYFNLSAILGKDHLFRPAARYELGPMASASFKALIEKANITNPNRLENKKRILAAIDSGEPLLGCLKAKEPTSETALESIAAGYPVSTHPVIMALQASNPQPQGSVQLLPGYTGDLSELAREYSIIMTLDAIFQQWDRYSGGNVSIQKDSAGLAHFYFTDNGGADLTKGTASVEKNLNWFSRYDRDTVVRLQLLATFLENPSRGYLGYSNGEAFIVDLGLYSEITPASYLERFQRNLKMFLARVDANVAMYGDSAYF